MFGSVSHTVFFFYFLSSFILYILKFIKLDFSPLLLLCNTIYISSLFVHVYLLRTQVLGVELHAFILHSDL